MGGKFAKPGKHLYLSVAGLIFILLQGCVAQEKVKVKLMDEERVELALHRSQGLLAEGRYDEALEESEKALALSKNMPPGDAALLNMALIYAHADNPRRNYKKSLVFLAQLMKDFPQSPLVEQAKIWRSLLQENEGLSQEVEALYQKTEAPPAETKAEEQSQLRETLSRAQKLLSQGDYEAALRENQKVLAQSERKPPGDEALFNIGVLFAHPGNPKRDYSRSMTSFKRLGRDFPDSPFTQQARFWIGMLQENEKLNLTIESLNQVIEKSKKVDLEIEEKKREKAR